MVQSCVGWSFNICTLVEAEEFKSNDLCFKESSQESHWLAGFPFPTVWPAAARMLKLSDTMHPLLSSKRIEVKISWATCWSCFLSLDASFSFFRSHLLRRASILNHYSIPILIWLPFFQPPHSLHLPCKTLTPLPSAASLLIPGRYSLSRTLQSADILGIFTLLDSSGF